ncbi:hypothetical protein ACFVVX_13930 [Kitasatospora sp. NPDC058170]|uniref:hypothetical protein n=1 Tax=Kitasatospora sp. NPDC058170 TaxID=3346364 RepID=UPI0036DAD661
MLRHDGPGCRPLSNGCGARPCGSVVLQEFELGWPAGQIFADPDPLANVGACYLIVDRRNSRVTTMPPLAPETVLDMYRARYPAH